MMISNILPRRTIIAALISTTLIIVTISDVQAGRVLRKGVQGAAAGALVGAVVGGSDAAAKGAVIGGAVGAISGARDNRRHRRHRNRVKHHRRRR